MVRRFDKWHCVGPTYVLILLVLASSLADCKRAAPPSACSCLDNSFFPPSESVTQLLAQYGRVVMVRICSRGNTSKLPAWLAKAVESINVTMAPGEFALVEFGSEEDCVACVTKTKNPDNW